MQIFRPLPKAARLPLRVYRLFFPAVFAAMLPRLLGRMIRRGQFRHKFGQRLGLYAAEDRLRLEEGGWTWIHAVSVGEMMMGIRLARTLQEIQPGLRVLISTTTSTGYAVAREQIANSIAARRFGRPEELGDACAFLCSAQAGFISGQQLQMDGGSYRGLV